MSPKVPRTKNCILLISHGLCISTVIDGRDRAECTFPTKPGAPQCPCSHLRRQREGATSSRSLRQTAAKRYTGMTVTQNLQDARRRRGIFITPNFSRGALAASLLVSDDLPNNYWPVTPGE